MTHELALKIQAFVDGELPASETGALRELLEKDPAARALRAELEWSRKTIAANEPVVPLPESGDFYWSKIRRATEAPASRPAAVEPATVSGSLAKILRWIVPLTGAALAILLFLPPRQEGPADPDRVADNTEIAIADTTGLAFHSETDGMTVMWVQSDAN